MRGQAKRQTWDLSGLNVTQLRLDYQFHVHMWSPERDLVVTFGTSFTFRAPTGESRAFDPEQTASLCPLLSLLHRPVAAFAISSESECVLRFEDGSELRGEPHESYEAWEAHGTGDLEGASMGCVVGGSPSRR